jgi:hypothetical protein
MSKTEVANVAFMALLFVRELCFVFLLWSISSSNRSSGGGQIVLLFSGVAVSAWGLTTALLYQHSALAGVFSDLERWAGAALYSCMTAFGSCTSHGRNAQQLPIDTSGHLEVQGRAPERSADISHHRRSSVEHILRASLGDGGRPWVTSTRHVAARSLGSFHDEEGMYYSTGHANTSTPSVTGLDVDNDQSETPLAGHEECIDLPITEQEGFGQATAAAMSI